MMFIDLPPYSFPPPGGHVYRLGPRLCYVDKCKTKKYCQIESIRWNLRQWATAPSINSLEYLDPDRFLVYSTGFSAYSDDILLMTFFERRLEYYCDEPSNSDIEYLLRTNDLNFIRIYEILTDSDKNNREIHDIYLS